MNANLKYLFIAINLALSISAKGQLTAYGACYTSTNVAMPDQVIQYFGEHKLTSCIYAGYPPPFYDGTTLGDQFTLVGVPTLCTNSLNNPPYGNIPGQPGPWGGASLEALYYVCTNFSGGCSGDGSMSCDLADDVDAYLSSEPVPYHTINVTTTSTSWNVSDVGTDPEGSGSTVTMTAAANLLDARVISHDASNKDHCPSNCPVGMPQWFVSEPYINLWVRDCPVFYTTSLGQQIGFNLAYKQRDTRPLNTTVPPTGWGHNWFSYVHFVVPNYLSSTNGSLGSSLPGLAGVVSVKPGWLFTNQPSQWQAILYTTDGSQEYHDYNTPSSAESGLTLIPSSSGALNGGFQIVHPDGSLDIYTFVSSPTFSFGFATNRGNIYDMGTNPPNLFSFCDINNYCVSSGSNGDSFAEDQNGASAPITLGSLAGFLAADALLTQRVDSYGNTINLYYVTNSSGPIPQYYLGSLVDYDSKTTTFSYSGGLLSGVSMPYGRSASFTYSGGQMASMTDAQGMSSSFGYGGYPYTGMMSPTSETPCQNTNVYLTSMTTPYGTTSFSHYESAPVEIFSNPPSVEIIDGSLCIVRTGNIPLWLGWCGATNQVNRACTVTYPDGTHELYMYRYDSRGLVPGAYPTNEVAYSGPEGTTDDGVDSADPDVPGSIEHLLSTRNSYHWNRQQYQLLSTNNIQKLQPADYAVATMKHWLADDESESTYPQGLDQNVSDQVSLIRGASPNGSTTGPMTWFNYGSKPAPWQAGDDTQIYAAELLPAGGMRQVNTNYSDGLLSSIATSYSQTDGSTSTRTTSYAYGSAGGEDAFGSYSYNLLQSLYPPYGGFSITYASDYSWMALQDPQYGFTTTYYYNTRHQVTGIAHADGLTTTNIYGSNGFLSESIDIQSGSTNLYSFANGLLSSYTSPLGLHLNFSWDNLSRLTQISFPDGTTISNVYNKLDLVAHKDRLNHWSYTKYDDLDELTSSADANGNTNYYSYCYCGALASITDPLGDSTSFTRDNDGNVTEAASSDGFSVTYNRDILGQLTNLTTTAGLNLNYAHNNQGLVTNVFNSLGTIIAAEYDACDNPIYLTDAQGVTITNQLDDMGRVLYQYNAFGQFEQNSYVAQGISWHKDALNNTTFYSYDPAGRLTTVTDANNHTNGFTYNAANELATLADGNGHLTSWAYNIYGQNISKMDGNGILVATNGYDAGGRLTAHWTPAKGLTSYTYDADGNPLTVSYSSGPGVSVGYDGLNRITTMNDAIGYTTFAYTNFGPFNGALAAETGPWTSDKVTNVYNNRLLQSLTLSEPTGSWTESFGFDGLLRLDRLVSPAGTYTYDYYGAGQQIQELSISGSVPIGISQTFDAAGRLKSTALLSNSVALDSYAYDYNADGDRMNVGRVDGSQVDYGYDNVEQLISATGLEPNGVTQRGNENFGYGYDPAGNLNLRTNNTIIQAFTTDGANQLLNVSRSGLLTFSGNLTNSPTSLKINGQSATIYHDLTFAVTNGLVLNNGLNEFTSVINSGSTMTNVYPQMLPASVNLAYDANGNMTSDGLHGFVYDCANELVQETITNFWQNQFTYDGLGRRRIRKNYVWQSNQWTLTNTVYYVYNGMTVIQERDVNNNPLVTYTRGTDLSGTAQGAGGIGGLLARTDTNGSSFYHTDGNGNVTMLVSGTGTIMAKYLYDSYGNTLGTWGTLAAANTYRYSSKEVDLNSGLYYYGYRYYQPNLQRWPNQDPIEELGGLNLYGYVGNNPVNYVDPFGLAEFPPNFVGPLQPGDYRLPPFQPINPTTRDSLSKYFQDEDPNHLKNIPNDELEKARDNAQRACEKYKGQGRPPDKFYDLQDNRRKLLDDLLNQRNRPPVIPWWEEIPVPIFMFPWQDPNWGRDPKTGQYSA